MASRAPDQDFLVGSELGRYRIVEKIGAGGMGEVYRARDQHLARDVAIKVLPPGTLSDESARKHFHKEALILSQLNHPNVATIHDFDTQRGVDFLVMEYIPGITLSEKVAGRPLPEKDVLRLGVQLAEGLAAAHDKGVIHRDLKPGNLRVTNDGRLKILDFGLAKLRLPVTDSAPTESLSETQAMAGTLPYMAPEQLLGEAIDACTDIHAAGSVLYEMATGQRPFAEVERSQLIGAILHRPARAPTALNPSLSSELERIIGKCLEKEQENRYQSAKELAVDLRRLSTPSIISTVGSAKQLAWWKRPKEVAMGALALLILVVLISTFNVRGWRDRLSGHSASTPIRSLAVLPLANLSGSAEQEYFTDGMTDQLITDLSKIGALKVIARSSVMHYKKGNKTVREIARELHVAGVVQGSVLRSGDRVRITVQLTDAGTDEILWAQSYQRDLRDALTLQEEVATAISYQIQAKLTPDEKAYLSSTRTTNAEAYQLYLKGRFFWNMRTPEGFLKALEFFQRAIERDPRYAEAHAGLADTYTLMADYGLLSPGNAYPRARAAALSALELDETLAEAHTSLAGVLEDYDWDWLNAERQYRRAIELNPNYATAHQWFGTLLSTLGRHEEAIAEAEKAQELAPLSPRTITDLGYALYWTSRYDEAIDQCRKALELDPKFIPAHELLGLAYLGKNAYEDAVNEYQEAAALSSGSLASQVGLAYTYAKSGNKVEAQKIVSRLRAQPGRQPTSSYQMAIAYMGLGGKEKALESLEEAHRGEKWLVFLKVDQAFDPLRSDPRFKRLLRRMNFPE
jgi:serine/threonine-protein kinase